MYAVIGAAGFSVNLLSAVYGLMPFIPMDGDKVCKWSRGFWLLAFVPVMVIYLLILFQ
jgi:Zn-dependent protease